MPFRALFGVAAGLVFFCLLAALVQVVNGQVEKAHRRDAQYNAAQLAIADCSKTYSGAARSQCIEQANAALNPYPAYAPEPETRAITQLAEQGNAISSTARAQGLMPATFASHQ